MIQKGGHIGVKNEVHSPARDPNDQRIQRIVLTSLGSESVAECEEIFLVDGVQHSRGRSLDDLVLECRDAPRIMHLMQLAFGMTGEDGPSLRPISAGVDPHCH